MPQRIIREGLLTSEAYNGLDMGAQLFFVRLMLKADDLGLYDARPRTLKMELYGYMDAVTPADCAAWLAACVQAGLIRTYEHDGKPFLFIERFNQELRRLTPKCPLPPWITRHVETEGKKKIVRYTCTSRGGRVHLTCTSRGGRVSAEEKRSEEKRSEEKRSEEKNPLPPLAGRGAHAPHGAGSQKNAQEAAEMPDIVSAAMDSREDTNAPSAPRQSPNLRPSDSFEVYAVMKACANCMLSPRELDACASQFFNSMEACGWVDSRGRPVCNWQAAARAYLGAWQNNRNRPTSRNAPQPPPRKDCNDPEDYR